MIFPEIRALYKYMPINENTLGCILKNEFWFSKPAYFNDPLDCGIQLLNQIDENSLIKIIERDIIYSEKSIKNNNQIKSVDKFKNFLNKLKSENIDFSEINEEFNTIAKIAIDKYSEEIQKIGILSLSEINNNILMWSHYAQQHNGICIEFERCEDNILSNNKNTLPVRYSIKKPLISLSDEILGDINLKKEIRRSLIYTKSVDWNYEREWRVVIDEGNVPRKINAPMKRIYFGYKTSDSHKKTIAKIVEGKNIELMEMKIKDNDFGLDFTNYEKTTKEKLFVDLGHLSPEQAFPFPTTERKRYVIKPPPKV